MAIKLASKPLPWKRHLPSALLVLALSASLAWQGVEWLRLLRSPPPPAPPSQAPAATTLGVTRLAPLFGHPPEARDAPATRLGLTLQGSIVNADPRLSSAIIQAAGAPARHYRPGQELEPGVRLHAVYPDRVEIERNGSLETLHFPYRGKPDAAPATRQAPPGTGAPVELEELPDEDLEQLRERLSGLREQLEGELREETDETP